jgi:hypothetical protein
MTTEAEVPKLFTYKKTRSHICISPGTYCTLEGDVNAIHSQDFFCGLSISLFFSCIPQDNNTKHAAPSWSRRLKQMIRTKGQKGTGSTNSLKYTHTSFSSSMNVFLVLGLSRSVRASMSLATPPSVPDDSTTIPGSSREIFKSDWRKQFK